MKASMKKKRNKVDKKKLKKRTTVIAEKRQVYIPKCTCECPGCEDYGFHCKKPHRGCHW